MTAHIKPGLGLLFAMAVFCCLSWINALAQRQQVDPLTDQQVDQLRENGDNPPEKIKLFLSFITQRTDELHRLSTASQVQNQDALIHNVYEEFASICDELEDNLDSFADQHADMRKVLKTVVAESEKWPAELNEPQASSGNNFELKAALAAGASVHDDAKQILDDQEKYFSQQKTGKK
jgi:hypothetical protein